MNRLGHALNNTEIYSQNLSDSRSRVEDTDYAYWMAQMARHEIVRQQHGNVKHSECCSKASLTITSMIKI